MIRCHLVCHELLLTPLAAAFCALKGGFKLLKDRALTALGSKTDLPLQPAQTHRAITSPDFRITCSNIPEGNSTLKMVKGPAHNGGAHPDTSAAPHYPLQAPDARPDPYLRQFA